MANERAESVTLARLHDSIGRGCLWTNSCTVFQPGFIHDLSVYNCVFHFDVLCCRLFAVVRVPKQVCTSDPAFCYLWCNWFGLSFFLSLSVGLVALHFGSKQLYILSFLKNI